MVLKEKEKDRYSRQLILEEIGEEGQEILSRSSVVIIGCGALGCVIANNLCRAGVGKIRLIDRDIVELNNLQRQLLLDEDDIGRPKAIACIEKLKLINSEINLEPIVDDVNHLNIEEFIAGYSVILDATDNLETRFLINDACVKSGQPWIYGGAIGTYGMTLNIIPHDTPCLRCITPQLPKPGTMATCDTAGILNTLPVIIASIQSTEALKIILKKDHRRTLLAYDIWTNEYQSMDIERNENCLCCEKREFDSLESEKREIITSLCGTNTIQIIPVDRGAISLDTLGERLGNVGAVEMKEGYLSFKTKEFQMDIFQNGRTIIHGTEDGKLARSLMAKYVGV